MIDWHKFLPSRRLLPVLLIQSRDFSPSLEQDLVYCGIRLQECGSAAFGEGKLSEETP